MQAITHNWSRHVAFGATATAFPETVSDAQDIVWRSDKVRVIGARHSFNTLADTSGTHLSLRKLARLIEIDAASRTVVIDGGVTYAELCPVLDASGWALANLASVPDFTVAGAVSTATHGSGDGSPNLAGAVAGLELVTASGDIVALRRGDAEFNGAVVALGAHGVVVSLTLDIVPQFDVRQLVYHRLRFEDVVEQFDALMCSAYSVSLFTHWSGDFVDQAFVKARVSEAPLGASFFGGQAATGPSSPVVGADPTGTTEQLGVPGRSHERIPHARIGALPDTGQEVQAEYFVARADAPAALRAVKVIEASLHPELIVSEVRTVAADELWLSPNYQMDSVAIHFAFRHNWPRVSVALGRVEAALAPFKPRPHWGKLFALPAADIQACYPRLAGFRTLAARLDPVGKFRNAYLDEFVFGA